MDLEEDGFEDGSTWPSSRDWELGAAKADAVLGEMVVVLIWRRVGDEDPGVLVVCVLFPVRKVVRRLSVVCAHAVLRCS